MSQFAWPFLSVVDPYERYSLRLPGHTNHRASLSLAYSDAQGALLVCTLLPGGIRFIWRQDKLLILQNGIYLGLSAVEHISQSSGIYSRIPANTPDNFNLF